MSEVTFNKLPTKPGPEYWIVEYDGVCAPLFMKLIPDSLASTVSSVAWAALRMFIYVLRPDELDSTNRCIQYTFTRKDNGKYLGMMIHDLNWLTTWKFVEDFPQEGIHMVITKTVTHEYTKKKKRKLNDNVDTPVSVSAKADADVVLVNDNTNTKDIKRPTNQNNATITHN